MNDDMYEQLARDNLGPDATPDQRRLAKLVIAAYARGNVDGRTIARWYYTETGLYDRNDELAAFIDLVLRERDERIRELTQDLAYYKDLARQP